MSQMWKMWLGCRTCTRSDVQKKLVRVTLTLNLSKRVSNCVWNTNDVNHMIQLWRAHSKKCVTSKCRRDQMNIWTSVLWYCNRKPRRMVYMHFLMKSNVYASTHIHFAFICTLLVMDLKKNGANWIISAGFISRCMHLKFRMNMQSVWWKQKESEQKIYQTTIPVQNQAQKSQHVQVNLYHIEFLFCLHIGKAALKKNRAMDSSKMLACITRKKRCLQATHNETIEKKNIFFYSVRLVFFLSFRLLSGNSLIW